jgi:hypothetical protein
MSAQPSATQAAAVATACPVRPPDDQAGGDQPGCEQQQCGPGLRVGEHQPGGNSARKCDHRPRRKLGAFGLKPFFRTCEEGSGLPVRRSRYVCRGDGDVHAASFREGKQSGGTEERGKRA